MTKIFSLALVFLSTALFAETADVKLKDVKTDDQTSIVIRKGKPAGDCVDYEVVEGSEEVFGVSHFDKSKAYESWDAACKEWKVTMRELNKENKILSLNCRKPTATKEGDQHTYNSLASYKLRVRIRDRN